MPVVEQRQGSPPGRQFRVKWTADEGGDGTTFSSWMRPPTGAVRYRSTDLHEQARGPLGLLQKVDAKVLAALVEHIDSPFEPGLTRSDSARDGAGRPQRYSRRFHPQILCILIDHCSLALLPYVSLEVSYDRRRRSGPMQIARE